MQGRAFAYENTVIPADTLMFNRYTIGGIDYVKVLVPQSAVGFVFLHRVAMFSVFSPNVS